MALHYSSQWRISKKNDSCKSGSYQSLYLADLLHHRLASAGVPDAGEDLPALDQLLHVCRGLATPLHEERLHHPHPPHPVPPPPNRPARGPLSGNDYEDKSIKATSCLSLDLDLPRGQYLFLLGR